MDKFLPYIPLEEFTVGERGEAVRFLILRGYFELAGEWLRQYGPYFVEPKLLVRLILLYRLSPQIHILNLLEYISFGDPLLHKIVKDNLLEEYYKKEFLNSRLFELR